MSFPRSLRRGVVDLRPDNPRFERGLRAAIRDTIATGRTFACTCPSCGQEITATIGGRLPVGAYLVAGPCTSRPGHARYTHAPQLWWMGGRIR